MVFRTQGDIVGRGGTQEHAVHSTLFSSWAQFFIDMRSKGEVGSFLEALLHLPLGLLIVSFHNVWNGLPIVLTLIGGLVLKSVIYLLFPGHGARMLGRVSRRNHGSSWLPAYYRLGKRLANLYIVQHLNQIPTT